MFQKLIFGDPEQPDYTERCRPATRPELFKRVLADKNGSMVLASLLYTLPLLPATIWIFYSLASLYSAVDASVQDLSGLYLRFFAVLVPLWGVTGPFTAGFAYIHGRWARDEACPLWPDFWNGVRDNAKQALVISFITALTPLLLYCAADFYLQLAVNNVLFILPITLCAAAVIIWSMSLGTIWGMMTSYKLPLFHIIKNSIFLTLGKLPRSIGLRVLTILMPLFLLLSALLFPAALMIGSIAVIVFTLVFGLSLSRLIQAAYANYLCETYINARIPGLPTRIGLRAKSKSSGK